MRGLLSDHGTGEAVAAAEGGRLRRLASYASVTVALILIAGKAYGFLQSNSIAVLVSLLDSLLDLLASATILLSIMYAQRPADRSHRYGHGKAEPLAALIQSGFIIGSAATVSVELLNRLLEPQPVGPTGAASLVMIASLVLTGLLVLFQHWVARRTGSVAIESDRAHYAGDFVLSAGVLLTLMLTDRSGVVGFDTGLAFIAVLFWVWSAWGIGYRAFHLLLDHELPGDVRARIQQIVTAHALADDLHDLRTRTDGMTVFIEFHLEMDGTMTISEAHKVTDALESDLMAAFPNAEVIIHQEPAGIDDDRLDRRLGRQHG